MAYSAKKTLKKSSSYGVGKKSKSKSSTTMKRASKY
jgi:hypothetical protein